MTFTLKPEILCHPNIPKPLHGVNPRTIKGKEWWDIMRKDVYDKYDYHCVACGVRKQDAKKHKWLEAHEFWDINYTTGICKVESIEPLCHYCHNFIHSGRLYMIAGKEKPMEEVRDILSHGFNILHKNGLAAYPFTYELAKHFGVDTKNVHPYEMTINENLKWNDYVLIFEGKEYRSQEFNSLKESKEHYQKL